MNLRQLIIDKLYEEGMAAQYYAQHGPKAPIYQKYLEQCDDKMLLRIYTNAIEDRIYKATLNPWRN